MLEIYKPESRIKLKLLSENELKTWLESVEKLSTDINLVFDTEDISEIKVPIQIKLEKMSKDPNNELWYSYFLIIFDNKAVGTIGPKGKRKNNDEIEIGYGINKKYWNNGIMTETVNMFCDYYFTKLKIKTIYAYTDVDNISSQKVLEKNGFKKEKEIENEFEWKLRKNT